MQNKPPEEIFCPLCAITGKGSKLRRAEKEIDKTNSWLFCPVCWVLSSEEEVTSRWLDIYENDIKVLEALQKLVKFSPK